MLGNTVGKGKNACYKINFSFYHSFYKRNVLKTSKKQGIVWERVNCKYIRAMLWASLHTREIKDLFGKGLTVNTYEPCSGHLCTHVKQGIVWERVNCKYIQAMLWASLHKRKTKGLFGKGLIVYT